MFATACNISLMVLLFFVYRMFFTVFIWVYVGFLLECLIQVILSLVAVAISLIQFSFPLLSVSACAVLVLDQLIS